MTLNLNNPNRATRNQLTALGRCWATICPETGAFISWSKHNVGRIRRERNRRRALVRQSIESPRFSS